MKFLANENFPLKSIIDLRSAGYDVVAVIEETPGVEDEEILKQANKEKRIILTFDRDYGELIYKKKLPMPKGVIYLRFLPSSPEEPAEYVLQLIKKISLDDKFTVVERERIRQRALLYRIK